MKSASRLLAAALLVGLALRLALLLIPTAPLATKATEPTGDSPDYVWLATNLVHRHIFSLDSTPPFRPDLLRTPVYPLFLALPALMTRPSSPLPSVHHSSFIVLALILQVLLSLAAIWLTRRLGLELGLAPRTAALAALLVALSPNLVFYSIKLTTETLFVCILLVTLLLVNRFGIFHRWQDVVAVGAGCGLLILTRPIAVFFPLLLALHVFCKTGRNWQLAIRNSLILLASAAVVLAPWVIRNGRVSGRYILSTAFDYNISEYSGAQTLAAARMIPVDEARDSLAAEAESRYGPLDENDRARYWAVRARVGRQELLARPLLAAKVHAAGSAGGLLMPLSVRALRAFSGADLRADTTGDPHVAQRTVQLVARGRIGQAIALIRTERLARLSAPALAILGYAILFHATLLVAFLFSLFLKRSRRLLWLLLPILYYVLSTGPVGEARFRVPVEPLLCLLAALALTRVPRSTPPTPHSPSPVP